MLTCLKGVARGLNFGLSLRLHPYFAHASNEENNKSVHLFFVKNGPSPPVTFGKGSIYKL